MAPSASGAVEKCAQAVAASVVTILKGEDLPAPSTIAPFLSFLEAISEQSAVQTWSCVKAAGEASVYAWLGSFLQKCASSLEVVTAKATELIAGDLALEDATTLLKDLRSVNIGTGELEQGIKKMIGDAALERAKRHLQNLVNDPSVVSLRDFIDGEVSESRGLRHIRRPLVKRKSQPP